MKIVLSYYSNIIFYFASIVTNVDFQLRVFKKLIAYRSGFWRGLLIWFKDSFYELCQSKTEKVPRWISVFVIIRSRENIFQNAYDFD